MVATTFEPAESPPPPSEIFAMQPAPTPAAPPPTAEPAAPVPVVVRAAPVDAAVSAPPPPPTEPAPVPETPVAEAPPPQPPAPPLENMSPATRDPFSITSSSFDQSDLVNEDPVPDYHPVPDDPGVRSSFDDEDRVNDHPTGP
ncbi:MAG TPA: hypothetical protein VH560_09470 [Polyangia bacterium]|nr:hypothetical protein [Polyangia bacterium]